MQVANRKRNEKKRESWRLEGCWRGDGEGDSV
jgi:hypothetical protein